MARCCDPPVTTRGIPNATTTARQSRPHCCMRCAIPLLQLHRAVRAFIPHHGHHPCHRQCHGAAAVHFQTVPQVAAAEPSCTFGLES